MKKSKKHAYSLVEMMVSLFIFAIMSLAFAKGLSHAKFTAEDNLYEATALTVAISTIEQMKGASTALLENPPKVDGKETFSMIIEDGKTQKLFLAQDNELKVPVITDSLGTTAKTFSLTIKPSIEKMTQYSGYWLTIEYSYDHPRSGRTRTQVVRNAMSTVPIL